MSSGGRSSRKRGGDGIAGLSLGLDVANLQSEAEIITATPRRPAGEFSVLTAMQSNMAASSKPPPSARLQGKLLSNSESKQRRLMDSQPQDDVQEESEDEYGDDDFDNDYDDDFEDDPALEKLDFDDVKQPPPMKVPSKKDGGFSIHSSSSSSSSTNQSGLRSYSPALNRSRQHKQQQPKAGAAASEWLVERVYVPKRRTSPEEQATIKREKQRVNSIMRDVELSFESFDLIRRDAKRPYEAHIRAIARGSIKESATQYNDDWRDVSVQTDKLRRHNIATQHPDYLQSGAAITDSAAARLPDFVYRAAQVIESLILERNRGIGFWSLPITTGSDGYSYAAAATKDAPPLTTESSFTLTLPRVLSRRRVLCMHFSASDPNVLLVSYGKEKGGGKEAEAKGEKKSSQPRPSSSKGPKMHVLSPKEWEEQVLPLKALVCVWRINQPESPATVLYLEEEAVSIGLSLENYIAFAGTRSGSIVVWDLREKPILHRKAAKKGPLESLVVLRHPSFSTDHLLGQNHTYPVKKVIALHSEERQYSSGAGGAASENGRKENQKHQPNSSNSSSSSSSSSSIRRRRKRRNTTSFQLASVDESGTTIIWTIVELQTGDVAGSETDFGLNLGSRIKVIKSIELLRSDKLRCHAAIDIKMSKKDPSHLLLALQNGTVTRRSRFGGRPSPTAYFNLKQGAFEEEITDFNDEYLMGKESQEGEAKEATTTAAARNKDWGFNWELLEPEKAPDARASFTRLMSNGGSLLNSDKKDTSSKFLDMPPPCALRDPCTCIAISPFCHDFFLTAYRSGQLSLFRLSLCRPVKTWSMFGNGAIRNVRWSSTRPAVFYALDASGMLHSFDLLQSEYGPANSILLEKATRGAASTSLIDLSCATQEAKEAATGIYKKNKRENKTTMMRPTLAYADQATATITISGVTGKYAIPKKNELVELQSLLSHLC